MTTTNAEHAVKTVRFAGRTYDVLSKVQERSFWLPPGLGVGWLHDLRQRFRALPTVWDPTEGTAEWLVPGRYGIVFPESATALCAIFYSGKVARKFVAALGPDCLRSDFYDPRDCYRAQVVFAIGCLEEAAEFMELRRRYKRPAASPEIQAQRVAALQKAHAARASG